MKVVITMPNEWLDKDGTVADEFASEAVDYIGLVRDEIMACCSSGHVDAEMHWEIQR